MMNDLRYAVRQLMRSPGFTATALLVLALGMAGPALIFSIANGVFLKPWPFRDPGRLVDINEVAPKWTRGYIGIAWPDFEAWRGHNSTFDGMAVLQTGSATLTTETLTERINISRVSHELPTVLGLEPVVGRSFSAAEEGPGAARVALLGHKAWRTLFAADPGVLGRSIAINREPFTVIGVLPPGGAFPNDAAVWVPVAQRSSAWSMLGVGRLKPGISVDAARADLLRIHRGLVSARKENETTSPTVMGLKDRYVGDARVVGGLLMAGGLLVLLIACGNVAALLVARGIARRAETAMRLALGSSPGQLARQVVIECGLLCGAGGVLGLLLARWLSDGALAWLPARLPAWVSIAMDARFGIGFAGVVSVAAVTCALLPVRDAVRHRDLRTVIVGGESAGSGSRYLSLRALVVGETAFAVTLLLAAGLLVQALDNVRRIDPGFAGERVLTYGLSLKGSIHTTPEAQRAFFEEHLSRVRALPGVVAASACTSLPLTGNHVGSFFEPEGALPRAGDAPDAAVHIRKAMPEYFSVMGIPLVAGRSFDGTDGASAGSRVVIVDELLARRFWPQGDALGRRLRSRGSQGGWSEVVGVVRPVAQGALEEQAAPGLYLPYRQEPAESLAVAVKHDGEVGTLAPAIRALVRAQDAGLAVSDLATMGERVSSALWLRRFYSGVIAAFAGVALTLVGAGLFGVVSYVVQQRMREMGIRLALGARGSGLLLLVLRQALGLAGLGLAVGLVVGLFASGFIRTLLFGVSPLSPLVLGSVALALTLVVALACAAPMWRVARLNPVEVLRSE